MLPQFRRAATNSVIVTVASAAIALPIGTAAALALVRHRLRAGSFWNALVLSPLIRPERIELGGSGPSTVRGRR